MQRTPGKSVEAREKYWTKIIIAARAFPEGITAYCRFMNVSKNNYYFWFKRLRQQHPDWHDLSNYPEIVASSRQKQPVEGEDPTPATKVEINTRRRKWSIADKTRLLEETDNAEPSELGAILRRCWHRCKTAPFGAANNLRPKEKGCLNSSPFLLVFGFQPAFCRAIFSITQWSQTCCE